MTSASMTERECSVMSGQPVLPSLKYLGELVNVTAVLRAKSGRVMGADSSRTRHANTLLFQMNSWVRIFC